MTTGDCFIMIGSSQDKPMTMYKIDSVRDDKIDAFSILIKNEQIMGWDFPDVYDNDIPEKAILLPPDTYAAVKQQMEDFYVQSRKLIQENLVDGDFEVEIGRRYCYRSIRTVTKIEENRVYYDLFRIDPENISPCWTGNERADGIQDRWRPIKDGLYEELLRRYRIFVAQLQERLFILAISRSGTSAQ